MIKLLRRVLKLDKAKPEDLMKWAQVEYGKDWEFAYNHMLLKGKPPITKGVYR